MKRTTLLAVAALVAPMALRAADTTAANATSEKETVKTNAMDNSNTSNTSNTSGVSTNERSTTQSNDANTQSNANTSNKNDVLASLTADQREAASTLLADLHRANLDEIDMGKMAEKNGKSDELKKYAKRLVKDHEDADKKTKELADKAGIKLPDDDHIQAEREKHMTESMKAMKGAEFDQAFAKAMVRDHKRDIQKLEKLDQKLTGTPVATLVSEVLPKLREHLSAAQALTHSSPGHNAG